MLTRTVNYEDFLERPQTETLYFNITESELSKQFDIHERMEMAEKITKGEKRELTTAEKTFMFKLVEDVIKLAYGTLSEDGRFFRKSDEAWNDFISTNAYDAFMLGMFHNVQLVTDFFTQIMPKDMRAKVAASIAANPELIEQQRSTNDVIAESTATVEEPAKEFEDNTPIWLRENRDPTTAEVAAMSKEELVLAMSIKNQRGQ